MAISINQLLEKIESELHKAKQAGSIAKVRENVHSIKVLCELILEERDSDLLKQAVGVTQSIPQVVAVPTLTTKKLQEDEANGESLFDF
jgi:RNase P/RNase MRP subunit p30